MTADPSARSLVCAAGAGVGGLGQCRRVQFQLAVDQPEVAVTVMQGFRVRRVAEPDRLDDVFQCEIGEADLAVLRLAQLRLIGLGSVLDAMVQAAPSLRDGLRRTARCSSRSGEEMFRA